jgi:hypothetical protein
MRFPAPSLRHLARLAHDAGITEHALLDEPRRELGSCTDDAGRLLAVAARLPRDPDARRLAAVAVGFLEHAHDGDGRFRLRLGADGEWTDDPPSDDACGRAVHGLGVAAARARWPDVRRRALALFDAAAAFRSPFVRATAHAALGACELLAVSPQHGGARRLVDDAAVTLPRPSRDPAWPWPEPRLAYSNALLPEALLAVGAAAADPVAAHDALGLLGWLVDAESRETWFSFTPVGGRGPGDVRPAFDQQPIEAWAMADACARAYAHTHDAAWASAVRRAARWFTGDNDAGVAMFDPTSGGGYDGLEAGGVNRNQGAESTLAFVATMAQARRLAAGQAARSRSVAASASSR